MKAPKVYGVIVRWQTGLLELEDETGRCHAVEAAEEAEVDDPIARLALRTSARILRSLDYSSEHPLPGAGALVLDFGAASIEVRSAPHDKAAERAIERVVQGAKRFTSADEEAGGETARAWQALLAS